MREKESFKLLGSVSYLLQNADVLVWSKPEWPAEHRPNIEFICTNIQIGDPKGVGLVLHPDIKTEIRQLSQNAVEMSLADAALNKVTHQDPDTRIVYIKERALGLEDRLVGQLLYFVAGTDLLTKLKVISPENYSDEQRKFANYALGQLFVEADRSVFEKTTIKKSGFRETLFVDRFALTDRFPEDINLLNQIYPTAIEIITDQIMQRQGDIDTFERDVQAGKIDAEEIIDSPRFAAVLFAAMEYIDWRDILTAYKTGDVDKTLQVLGERQKVPDVAAGIFLELLRAIKEDEEMVASINYSVVSREN